MKKIPTAVLFFIDSRNWSPSYVIPSYLNIYDNLNNTCRLFFENIYKQPRSPVAAVFFTSVI